MTNINDKAVHYFISIKTILSKIVLQEIYRQNTANSTYYHECIVQ